MRVALLAPVAYPVPPDGYGGTEHAVATLAQALVKRGLDVTIFASGDSLPGVPLRALFRHALGYGEKRSRAEYEQLEREHVCWAYKQAHEFDLVHDHTKTNGACLAYQAAVPVLTTVHNDLTPERRAIYARCVGHPFVALSHAHAQRMPELAWFGVVPNGVTIPKGLDASHRGADLLFFSRIDAHKGAHIAARLAHECDWPLVMAGRLTPDDQPFFNQQVAPFLDGVNRRFIGEVTGTMRWTVLNRAKALLFPITWSEPFGLVMIEAMATGTPVIAHVCGAVGEIVNDGVTGILLPQDATNTAWQSAVRRVAKLQSHDCVAHVQAHFSAQHMAAGYAALYEALLARDASST